jgi:hypothetical protein
MIAVETETETAVGYIAEKPPRNAVTHNASTLAAMQEAEDMASGKTPSVWYKNAEDMINALKEEISR